MDPSEAIPMLMDFAGLRDSFGADIDGLVDALLFLNVSVHNLQAGGDINAAASLYVDSVATNGGVSASSHTGDGLRAPDPEYSQTLLSPSFHSGQLAASSAGFTQRNVTALAVNSSVGTVAFRELFELPGGLSCQESFGRFFDWKWKFSGILDILGQCKFVMGAQAEAHLQRFCGGVWQAKELGRMQNKWLLVNIQQADAFESLRLNRDVWKAEVVQDLIKDFFIFWQRTDRCEEGQIFCDMYRVVFEFVERQQMAEKKRSPSPQPSEGSHSHSVPPGPTHLTSAKAAAVSPGAAPSELSVARAESPTATAAGAAVASTANEVDAGTGGHQLQSHKPNAGETEASAYKDVNSQLLDLRRLREERRQRQKKTQTQS
ncbi:hypothetical protein, conserved [Eimeria maxima]|uniref:Uncharacterized protein n=1 Tax=Eimeria maxima TaxID=5804 RepID=U6M6A5_EIMMA|nr:hypothetical protein, conserved [Eimeria maxima]CDJ59526.1 hypothetical protein, conserved [Eimeria maxima]